MDEREWSDGGMILTGENWSTVRKHYTAWVVDGWKRMERWWNDTDRGKLKYWEKTLYSVGGRWMKEYGAMVEWYWQGNTEALGRKPLSATSPCLPSEGPRSDAWTVKPPKFYQCQKKHLLSCIWFFIWMLAHFWWTCLCFCTQRALFSVIRVK